MSVSAQTLAAFRAEVGDIPCLDDAKTLALRSRDHFWYSPILNARLQDRVGQLLVQP